MSDRFVVAYACPEHKPPYWRILDNLRRFSWVAEYPSRARAEFDCMTLNQISKMIDRRHLQTRLRVATVIASMEVPR